jgi:hypothetical protein
LLTYEILAVLEAEIRRIVVPGKPGKEKGLRRDPISKEKSWIWWWYTSVIPADRKHKIGGSLSNKSGQK